MFECKYYKQFYFNNYIRYRGKNILGAATVACSASVLLVQANAKSSWSFVWPAIFDLQSEWMVGEGVGKGRKDFTPLPPPLSLFLTVNHPLGIYFYSP